MSTNGHLLQITGLKKRFGGLNALSDLELHVDEGEVVSVIGPNGAGKTTLFNMVTGLYEPDDGNIIFDGQGMVGLKPNQITRFGIARTFQTVHLFPNMTVLENAMVGQHSRTSSARSFDRREPAGRRSGSGRRRRKRSRSSGPVCPGIATTSPPLRSRTPTGDAWRSRGPWPRSRNCCFSMSPPRG